MLEQAWIRTAIDRCGDDQQVGLFDGQQLGFDLGRQLIARQCAAQWPGDVTEFDQGRLDRQQRRQFGQHGWVNTRVRDGRQVPPERATTFRGRVMNSSFFNSGIAGEVSRSEQELYQRLQALIRLGCGLTAEKRCCCLPGVLLNGCCLRNSCLANSVELAWSHL